MKKLIAGSCIAAALLFPATSAGASADAIVRVTSCPTQYTGTVVQVWQQSTGWVNLVWLCVPPIAP